MFTRVEGSDEWGSAGLSPRANIVLDLHSFECGIWNSILKFSDVTKVYGEVVNKQSREALQNDLDLLVKWSEEWQMNFNVKKCIVMHIGKNNMEYKYTMSGMELECTKGEKDLGVVMSSDLKSILITAYKHTTKPVGCLE